MLISVVWYDILAAIDICKKAIQARDASQNVSSIETLLDYLMKSRSSWKGIWNEAKEVALSLKIEVKFCQ